MTLNQKTLDSFLNNRQKDTDSYMKTAAADGIDRRRLSYLGTIHKKCSTKELQIIYACIQEDKAVLVDSGECTKSIEVLASLISGGAKVVATSGIPMVLYVLQSDGYTKIGVAKSITSRLKSLQTANPHKIVLLREYKFATETDARAAETSLHALFSTHKTYGEWFTLTAAHISELDNYITGLIS